MRHMRWCGDIAIAIALNEGLGERGEYVCNLAWIVNKGTRWEKRETARVVVGPAKCTPCGAFLSPDELDSVAHAALSFASDEGADIEGHAWFTDSGWAISRG